MKLYDFSAYGYCIANLTLFRSVFSLFYGSRHAFASPHALFQLVQFCDSSVLPSFLSFVVYFVRIFVFFLREHPKSIFIIFITELVRHFYFTLQVFRRPFIALQRLFSETIKKNQQSNNKKLKMETGEIAFLLAAFFLCLQLNLVSSLKCVVCDSR